MKFKAQIEEIFGTLKSYTEYPEFNEIRFEIFNGFTAEKLFKASDVLKTGVIEINSYSTGGGCDTCDFGREEIMEFCARGVKL